MFFERVFLLIFLNNISINFVQFVQANTTKKHSNSPLLRNAFASAADAAWPTAGSQTTDSKSSGFVAAYDQHTRANTAAESWQPVAPDKWIIFQTATAAAQQINQAERNSKEQVPANHRSLANLFSKPLQATYTLPTKLDAYYTNARKSSQNEKQQSSQQQQQQLIIPLKEQHRVPITSYYYGYNQTTSSGGNYKQQTKEAENYHHLDYQPQTYNQKPAKSTMTKGIPLLTSSDLKQPYFINTRSGGHGDRNVGSNSVFSNDELKALSSDTENSIRRTRFIDNSSHHQRHQLSTVNGVGTEEDNKNNNKGKNKNTNVVGISEQPYAEMWQDIGKQSGWAEANGNNAPYNQRNAAIEYFNGNLFNKDNLAQNLEVQENNANTNRDNDEIIDDANDFDFDGDIMDEQRLNELFSPFEMMLDKVIKFCDNAKRFFAVNEETHGSAVDESYIKMNNNDHNKMPSTETEEEATNIHGQTGKLKTTGKVQGQPDIVSTIMSLVKTPAEQQLRLPLMSPAAQQTMSGSESRQGMVATARSTELTSSSFGSGRKLKKFKKKLHKLLLPLVLAYKLKFLALIPVLIGGLTLLVGTTGLAGFFFALFTAVMSLKGSHGVSKAIIVK